MAMLQDIKKLRALTHAGMLNCKKALDEAGGDMKKAMDIIQQRGHKVAAKRMDRMTTAGASFSIVNKEKNIGVAFVLGCETDFVAKNKVFRDFGTKLAELALAHEAKDLATLTALNMEGETVKDKLQSLIGKLGENVVPSDYHILRESLVVNYTHTGHSVATLVACHAAQHTAEALQVAHDVALHITANDPQVVRSEDLSPDFVQKEYDMLHATLVKKKFPEQALEKALAKQIEVIKKSHTLLGQKFVKDSQYTVAEYLSKVPNMSVTSFCRVTATR